MGLKIFLLGPAVVEIGGKGRVLYLRTGQHLLESPTTTLLKASQVQGFQIVALVRERQNFPIHNITGKQKGVQFSSEVKLRGKFSSFGPES